MLSHPSAAYFETDQDAECGEAARQAPTRLTSLSQHAALHSDWQVSRPRGTSTRNSKLCIAQRELTKLTQRAFTFTVNDTKPHVMARVFVTLLSASLLGDAAL